MKSYLAALLAMLFLAACPEVKKPKSPPLVPEPKAASASVHVQGR